MTRPRQDLARRERQILEIVYRLEKATAAEVHDALPDSPSYSTVRKILSILEEKGHIKHVEHQRRKARTSALKQLLGSLFENSAESVVSTLMDISAADMSDDDLKRLARLIERHRKERQ